MIETSLLATVAAVVREGSFERAARVLHITPSAVSQRIRLIEERVGTVLVVRGQPCTPTEAGARLCRHAQTVAMLEEGLLRDMPELQTTQTAGTHATIRVAINADSLGTWFITALRDFCRSDGPLIDLPQSQAGRVAQLRHRLPSPQAFVEGALAGIGWGMNPLHLVGEHLWTGRLVELVSERPLDIPLYWQVAKLPLPELERLSQSVHTVANALLVH